jgi:hypothetical protein
VRRERMNCGTEKQLDCENANVNKEQSNEKINELQDSVKKNEQQDTVKTSKQQHGTVKKINRSRT